MEPKFQLTISGQEILQSDINQLGEVAAMQDDYILAELLRPKPLSGGVQKLIIPSARSGRTTNNLAGAAVVLPKAASDASILVRPFRAIVGITDIVSGIGHLRAFRDIRSAIHAGTTSNQPNTEIQLSATSSNHRWDLVYARVDVDIDTATVPRYVKNSSGVTAPQNVVPTKVTTVTIGVVEGAEGASPSRPALPSDSGSSYYIPLAYVFVPHPFTLTDPVDAQNIQEIFTPAYLGEALGVRHCGPPDQAFYTGGYGTSIDDWDASGRPVLHLPPSMHGGLTRFLRAYLFPTGTTVIDSSVDWRNRIFKWTAQYDAGAGLGPLSTGVSRNVATGLASSINSTPVTLFRIAAGDDADANSVRILPNGVAYDATFKVNSNGQLECAVTSGPLGASQLWVWLEATGPYDNSGF